MQISITFNWPPATDSARVSFGAANIEDPKYSFKVGVIGQADPEHVHWLKSESLENTSLGEIEFDVHKGDKVVVEKYQKEDRTLVGQHIWDITEKWPAEATGATSTQVPWAF